MLGMVHTVICPGQARASLKLLGIPWTVANTQGTYIPVMAALYLTSGYLANHNPEWLPLATAFTDKPSALPFALFVHFNGWFWQFLGHFRFEGRAPALFDNLTQGE